MTFWPFQISFRIGGVYTEASTVHVLPGHSHFRLTQSNCYIWRISLIAVTRLSLEGPLKDYRKSYRVLERLVAAVLWLGILFKSHSLRPRSGYIVNVRLCFHIPAFSPCRPIADCSLDGGLTPHLVYISSISFSLVCCTCNLFFQFLARTFLYYDSFVASFTP